MGQQKEQIEKRHNDDRTETPPEINGLYLKNIREIKGITLQEIAKSTCIRKGFLEAIEKDDFSEMPESIYLRGFIKAYAKHIGLNPEQIINSYNFK